MIWADGKPVVAELRAVNEGRRYSETVSDSQVLVVQWKAPAEADADRVRHRSVTYRPHACQPTATL